MPLESMDAYQKVVRGAGMILIKEKMHHDLEETYVFRHRIHQWFYDNIQKHPHSLLFGCRGLGKTTEVIHFAEQCFGKRYGYYCLDDCDNDVSQFQAYFFSMVKNAGLIDLPEELLGFSFHDFFAYILNKIAKEKKECMLILDNVEVLCSLEIMRELSLFIKYLPDTCVFFLVGNEISEKAREQILPTGDAHVLSAGCLSMNFGEFSKWVKKIKWQLDIKQSEILWKKTSGWPGIAQYVYAAAENRFPEVPAMKDYVLDKYLETDSALQAMPALELDLALENIVWRYLSEKEKNLLRYGSSIPFFFYDFLRKMIEKTDIQDAEKNLLYLEKAGLVLWKEEDKEYQVIEMMADFIRRRYPVKDREFLKKAAEWYETQGKWKAAIICLLDAEDEDLMAEFLKKHVYQLMHILKINDLKRCLQLVSDKKNDPGLIFWQGVYGVWNNDMNLLDRAEKNLTGPLLWNLYYLDDRISALEWLTGLQEAHLKSPLFLYDVTANQPDIRCGQKDLTEFFATGKKDEKDYFRKWKKLIHPEQSIYFNLASADYLIETDREKEAVEKLRGILSNVLTLDMAEASAAYMAMTGKLYRKGYLETDNLEILQQLDAILKAEQFEMLRENVKAILLYAHSFRHSGYTLGQWLERKTEIGENAITKDNEFLKRIHAKSEYGMQQYKKAQRIYARLVVYYRKKKLYQQCAECLFGRAASLFALGKRTEGLKIAAEALSIGIRFHYVGPYTSFGKTGVDLITQYQKLMGDRESKIMRKKKYFYGNILRAGFEDWQLVLLRCAKKEAKMTIWEEQNLEEPLTKTEWKVLRAISAGYSNQEIAEEFDIRLSTVKSHVSGIYRKLDVKNRVEVVRRGKELGLIELDV